jgi:hypothetical protein
MHLTAASTEDFTAVAVVEFHAGAAFVRLTESQNTLDFAFVVYDHEALRSHFLRRRLILVG